MTRIINIIDITRSKGTNNVLLLSFNLVDDQLNVYKISFSVAKYMLSHCLVFIGW